MKNHVYLFYLFINTEKTKENKEESKYLNGCAKSVIN